MKNAIVFPGQGSQSIGMGKDFADAFEPAQQLFDEANDILGYDVATICFEGPEEELTRSDRAQPAIFLVSAVAATVLRHEKPELSFDYTAGHSLGEWTALWYAGVVSFADTIKILEARGRFMQAACESTEGGMVAVLGIEDISVLEGICDKAGIYVANFNEPKQTVLSGAKAGVASAATLATEAGARRAVPLPVAGAFHSPLMQEAADRFAEFLESVSFSAPTLPVISNVQGGLHDPDTIRENMVAQIVSSVRWVDNIRFLKDAGVTTYQECGPGKVLSGLVKRIDADASITSLNAPAGLA